MATNDPFKARKKLRSYSVSIDVSEEATPEDVDTTQAIPLIVDGIYRFTRNALEVLGEDHANELYHDNDFYRKVLKLYQEYRTLEADVDEVDIQQQILKLKKEGMQTEAESFFESLSTEEKEVVQKEYSGLKKLWSDRKG